VINTTSDLNELSKMTFEAQKALGTKKLSAVADKGYYNGKEVLLCDAAGR
jgi:transposase